MRGTFRDQVVPLPGMDRGLLKNRILLRILSAPCVCRIALIELVEARDVR